MIRRALHGPEIAVQIDSVRRTGQSAGKVTAAGQEQACVRTRQRRQRNIGRRQVQMELARPQQSSACKQAISQPERQAFQDEFAFAAAHQTRSAAPAFSPANVPLPPCNCRLQSEPDRAAVNPVSARETS